MGYEVVPLALWARFALGYELWGRSPLTPFELRARSYTRFEVGLFHKPWDVSHYKSPYPSSVQNERRKNMVDASRLFLRLTNRKHKCFLLASPCELLHIFMTECRRRRRRRQRGVSPVPRPQRHEVPSPYPITISPQTFRLCNRRRRVLRHSRFPRGLRGSTGVQCCVRCNAESGVHRIPAGKHLPQSHQVPHPKA